MELTIILQARPGVLPVVLDLPACLYGAVLFAPLICSSSHAFGFAFYTRQIYTNIILPVLDYIQFRKSYNGEFFGLSFQLEPDCGERVEASPDKSIDGNNDHRHNHSSREEQAEIAIIRSLADNRT
jgi:hypothetical protein